MKMWKVLGLAGVAGVAATGAVLVRAERQRRQVTPQEVRDRLHTRLDLAGSRADTDADATPPTRRARLHAGHRRERFLHRRR
jgi:hypothetical protein